MREAVRARAGGAIAIVVAAFVLASTLFASAQSASAQSASAQEAADPNVEEARAAYLSGLAAAEEARWSDALGYFERAYALSSVASALFNVGTTLRALGRHRESRDTLARLLREHELDDATIVEATRIRNEEAARVARLTLGGVPEGATLIVRVDGRDVAPDAAAPLVLEVDPGEHALEVSAAGFETARWQGSLTDGEARTIALEMPTVARTPPIETRVELVTPPAQESSSVVESPWLWLAIGLAVLAGAGVVVGLMLQDQAQLQPLAGTFAVRL